MHWVHIIYDLMSAILIQGFNCLYPKSRKVKAHHIMLTTWNSPGSAQGDHAQHARDAEAIHDAHAAALVQVQVLLMPLVQAAGWLQIVFALLLQRLQQ